jgi:hypothetical protein
MQTTDYYTAIILVSAAQKVITHRRMIEHGCGYPPEYGGDEILLKRIDEFMSDVNIQHEVKDAIAFWEKFKENK